MDPTDAKHFLITVDAEDWFQVENFKSLISFDTWDRRELRVERNVHRLLDLFDAIKLPPEDAESTRAADPRATRATFFVLCWIAERLPGLVREIEARGHEIASHGCYHELPPKMPRAKLMAELGASRKRLEDTIGKAVVGYRAPSFAIDDGILAAIAAAGYRYDSSYNSFSLHGRYGKISLNGGPRNGIAHRVADNFCELPISNLTVFGSVLPLGGGAYFRLLPLQLFKLGVKRILTIDDAYVFYIHPWEIDPGQPRVTKASWSHKLRHYAMVSKTYRRLEQMIDSFKYCRFTTCSQYLTAQGVRPTASNGGELK
ncbi:MAG: polysaccharide deacetylase family protein [Desulfobacterales bacterium]